MNSKIYNYFLLFCSFFVFLSCIRNSKSIFVHSQPTVEVEELGKDRVINWGLSNTTNPDFYSDMVDSIRLIPLETKDNVLIGQISHIYQVNDTIVVVDAQKSIGIYSFNLEGKFLCHIGKRGEGPFEYMSINNVHLIGNRIYVVDWIKWSLICYDVLGNNISEHRFRTTPPENIIPSKDSNILLGSYSGYFEQNPYHLVWINEKDSIQETALPFNNTRPSPAGTLEYDSRGNIIYYHLFCDTIFHVENYRIRPWVTLGLYQEGEMTKFLKDTEKKSDEQFYKELYNPHNEKVVNFYQLTELESYWSVEYQKGPFVYISFINKKDKTTKSYLRSDLMQRKLYIPFVINAAYKDCLLTYIDDSFNDFVTSDIKKNIMKQSLSKEDITLLDQYDFNSLNPLICKIYVKNYGKYE